MREALKTALMTLTLGVGPALAWPVQAAPASAEAAAEPPPGEAVTRVARWVTASADNRGLPFVIVDKVAAQVFIHEPNGDLIGVAPALIGSARGDDSADGIGDRPLAAIAPQERTTPAGRFIAAYGWAHGGGRVLWVDFKTAVSLHPVITSNRRERRLERLNSPSPDDNRITFGCINVSADFYDQVVRKTFAGTSGVVYVLPEVHPLDEVFPGLGA